MSKRRQHARCRRLANDTAGSPLQAASRTTDPHRLPADPDGMPTHGRRMGACHLSAISKPREPLRAACMADPAADSTCPGEHAAAASAATAGRRHGRRAGRGAVAGLRGVGQGQSAASGAGRSCGVAPGVTRPARPRREREGPPHGPGPQRRRWRWRWRGDGVDLGPAQGRPTDSRHAAPQSALRPWRPGALERQSRLHPLAPQRDSPSPGSLPATVPTLAWSADSPARPFELVVMLPLEAPLATTSSSARIPSRPRTRYASRSNSP